ncbi:MAG: TAT-variant-translocated molybdopterin oxidoreductase [Spirochaetales bacterium]|nr:TAT-variant-translocated molybdopterin oxidoreductase [Leptospiraceae bacterium]MCP5480476.1 TAT-variant-translocated molybdopterin oxidoreductase [Spirochaetales bacterium]
MKDKQASKRHYWQSLEEREQPALSDWKQPEFQKSRNEMREEAKRLGFSRRDFLKFMGAGAVMAGAACRRPAEEIVPAVIRAPETVPGISTYYATNAPDGTGLIVRTREGRPVKLAGNPDHPLTAGGVTANTIATLHDLYDADRLRRACKIDRETGRKIRFPEQNLVQIAAARLANESFVLLTGPIDSPSSRALVQAFLAKYPRGRHIEFRADPVPRQIAAGQQESYGQAVVPNYRLDLAEVIVSIDGDFLGTMLFPAQFNASFGRSRNMIKNPERMNRLVVFESMFSLTGSNADERHSIRPGDQTTVALSLAAHIVLKMGQSRFQNDGAVRSLLTKYLPEEIARASGATEGLFRSGHYSQVIARVAEDLWAHRGRSLVLGGSPLAANGNVSGLQIAINLLNSMLENDGVTVDHIRPIQISPGVSDFDMKDLVLQMERGEVSTLIIAGANPVYHMPDGGRVAEALKKVSYVLSLNDRIDETSKYASAILPKSHYLECWGDTEIVKGVYGIQQPVVRPIHGTTSFEDRLIQLAGGELNGQASFRDFVMDRWRRIAPGGNFRRFWNSVLQGGYYAPQGGPGQNRGPARNFRTQSLGRLPQSPPGLTRVEGNQLRLGLYHNIQVLDGSGANNSLRQELPDPITKIVWNNYVSILPATARRLGLAQGQVVRIKTGEQSIDLPVHLQPGLHPEAAFIALGYGREAGGHIADCVGANAMVMARPGSDSLALSGSTVEIVATGQTHALPSTQRVYRDNRNSEDRAFFTPEGAHEVPFDGSSQHDRPIIRETSYAAYRTGQFALTPEAVHYPENAGIMGQWNYKDTRWHMVIDQTLCTGCGACVASCNQENNIPAVGPDQVAVGREMHWMRIDRYFSGSEEEPEVAHQPMLCQHCENAPCENVCPVAATTHTHDGLNVMTYNRCVGTRYCSNNCPYKVRRFNWYENFIHMEGLIRHLRDPEHLALNPDVTVRSRGVMEKCTFCIQRISEARQESRARGETFIPDGRVVTACQEVCPTGAIYFGNVLDPESDVARLSVDKRGYRVLDFLGVKPAITYLAKLRNRIETA